MLIEILFICDTFGSIKTVFQNPSKPIMSAKPKLNVHKFPRPPLLEQISRHLVIKWGNEVVADTKQGYWALETTVGQRIDGILEHENLQASAVSL